MDQTLCLQTNSWVCEIVFHEVKFVSFLNTFHQSYFQKYLGSLGLDCDSRLVFEKERFFAGDFLLKPLLSHWSN